MQRFQHIDGLRGILALWVLFGHTLASSGLGHDWNFPFNILADGVNAVDLFVIISGFVITYIIDIGREPYVIYLLRRFIRIYPVYFICIIVSTMLLPLEIQVNMQIPWPTHAHKTIVYIAQKSYEFLPFHLAAHLALVHSMIPDSIMVYSDYAILGQAWSLSLEWQYYVIAPIVLVALTRNMTTALIVVIIFALINSFVTGVQGFLPRHIPYFAIGIASYYILKQPHRPNWPLLVPVGVAMTYMMTHQPALAIWALVFLLTLQANSSGNDVMRQFLESKPLLWLGKISYSIYLSHTIILTLVLTFFCKSGITTLGQIDFFIMLLITTLLGTLIVSWLLFTFVEAPMIAFGKGRYGNLKQRQEG